ncbi:MAG: PEGA domain-containing protein [Planctomycetes bacterium]|nr:PEGA domain-containing protein [Planctomycetota bacterium]
MDSSYVDSWDQYAPQRRLTIESDPEGAMVEIFDENKDWITVGSTPTLKPLLLEATGKVYLIRISKQGYYSEVKRVALQHGDVHMKVSLRFDEFADPADYMNTEYRRDKGRE